MTVKQKGTITPIKRTPVVQQVEDTLRQLIKSGQYAPGDKLPAEMELCQQLGVGRGTVREAFRLLQAKEYVEIRPGRGAFVAQGGSDAGHDAIDWLVQNERELRNALEIRAALEPMAARLMAERCSKSALSQLDQLHRAFLLAVESQDADRIGRLDEQFHSAIVVGSENALLTRINNLVCDGMHTFRSKTFQMPQSVQNAIVPHTRILEALRSRDGTRAEREMRLHLDKVQEDLTRSISPYL